MPAETPAVGAERSEPVVVNGPVSAQLGKGQAVGSVATKSPPLACSNPAVEQSLKVTATTLQDIASDPEGSVAEEGRDKLSSTSKSIQKQSRSRHGRERRKPQRHGEWV